MGATSPRGTLEGDPTKRGGRLVRLESAGVGSERRPALTSKTRSSRCLLGGHRLRRGPRAASTSAEDAPRAVQRPPLRAVAAYLESALCKHRAGDVTDQTLESIAIIGLHAGGSVQGGLVEFTPVPAGSPRCGVEGQPGTRARPCLQGELLATVEDAAAAVDEWNDRGPEPLEGEAPARSCQTAGCVSRWSA